MDIDYPTILIEAFFNAAGSIATALGTAFQSNPWPFVGVVALALLGLLLPARRTRRGRRA